MSNLRFSVVVPTRERVATLRHCLHTCLDQQFDDYEVIVSDNGVSNATRELVEEVSAPKVRYVRTPGALAMASSWEFGVSHAQGEYVLVVGDDDGLLPHALRELDALFRKSSAKAIRWDAAYYTWPSFTIPGQADFLRIPLGHGLLEIDSMAAIRQVVEFREFYTTLPMLYNSAVHRDVLTELRAKTGRVFAHAIPDVYSGFAVAATVGRYLSTDIPMSVSGQSGASNGVAILFQRGQSSINKEFKDLNEREHLLPDPRVPDLPSFPHIPVADAFYTAKKHFFPRSDLNVDRRQFAVGCVANLRVANEGEWRKAMTQLRESLADVPDIQTWFDETLGIAPYRPLTVSVKPGSLGIDGEILSLDAAAFGVKDVAGAARLCENILNYARHGVVYLTDELASVKGITRSVLGVIESQRAHLRELQRGGRLKQTGRKVKTAIHKAYRKARNFISNYLLNPLSRLGVARLAKR